jgi:hypothetical protein
VNTHSNARSLIIRGNNDKVWRETGYYGRSALGKTPSKGVLLKGFDKMNNFMKGTFGLTTAEAYSMQEVVRIAIYYGNVYLKTAHFAGQPGRSQSTLRRAIRKLKNLGLITVIPRYLEPVRRQISNLYILQNLLLLFARYLAEHGQAFGEKWLKPYLKLPGSVFWRIDWRENLSLKERSDVLFCPLGVG